MIRELSITSWKFFFSGHGMSVRTGKYFLLAMVTGALAGLVTSAFHWMIGAADAGVAAIAAVPAALVFLPAVGAVAGSLLIGRFARVEHARGTDSAIRAFHRGELIPRTVIPVKSVASVLTVASGGSAGYEGPVTLLGAACGSVVSRLLKLDARAARILLAAGLAGGISALFRAPLAGAIFGAEIFYSSSDVEYDAILPSFIASAVSYTVFALFWGWHPLFSMPSVQFERGLHLLPYFALAIVLTFGARFYISFFRGLETRFAHLRCSSWAKVAAGGIVAGLAALLFPDVRGAGYAKVQWALQFAPDGISIRDACRVAAGCFAFFAVKAVATSFTVGSGGSGGVFAPAIACGGALGLGTGIMFRVLLPEGAGIQPAEFALVGMGGFLASTVRVPMTAVVIVSEVSGNHELLLPAMWVCGIAFWLNNGWSIYRSQVHDRDTSPLHSGA